MSSLPPGKRKSKTGLLQRPAFGLLSSASDDIDRSTTRTLKKKLRQPSLSSRSNLPASPAASSRDLAASPEDPDEGSLSPNARPNTLLRRGRPSSIFGSLKSFRTNDDDTPPATAASSKAPSLNWKDFACHGELTGNKVVLHHGEAQTNSSLFWKKKEYLVLTETHLVRFKNQSKAAETFHSIQQPHLSRTGVMRHASSPSVGSAHDNHSMTSDASADKVAGIPLEQVVAVYLSEDSKSSNSVEVAHMDDDAGQGSTISLQFADSEGRDLWAKSIRMAANRARLFDTDPISPKLSAYAARIVEREQDYDISSFRIYKAVRRLSPRTSTRPSAEDFVKSSSTHCFLVVGVRKIHLIPLPKNQSRVSNPSLADLNECGSFGILAMTAALVNGYDDCFSLSFRTPLQKPQVFHLASLASSEIALRIRHVEHLLRPDWVGRPYMYEVPAKVEDDFIPEDSPHGDDNEAFDRTLIAYCVAYGINPSVIRYAINYSIEDAPRFELLDSTQGAGRPYSPLELLAVFRSLRYNESFASISFARLSLTCLNGSVDRYGAEHVCMHTGHGAPVKLCYEEEIEASLLVQEIRALAISSRRLRRLDFTGCISKVAMRTTADANRELQNVGCGIMEALFPLCKQQATNVDWIALNEIELQEIDLDYLVSVAADKGSHFRAIEARSCGLTDRGVTLLLDVFRTHDNTLEALDISNNPLRIVPSVLSRQLQPFGYIRKLDLSSLAVSTSSDSLLPLEALLSWRLEDLRLRGLSLNPQTVDALCGYLAHPQSEVLRELILSHCSLSGADVAIMMQSMTQEPNTARFLHLDVSENNLQKKHKKLSEAIADGLAPTHFSMRSTEYDTEGVFENLLLALAKNKSIRYLDLAKASMPCEASEETCTALRKLFADNSTLEDLDISGEDSRLEVSKFGTGINDALHGLKSNKALQILRIQNQKLGLQGASTLAEVLKENNALRQIFCDCNGITLTGFTDLVNALATNTSVVYLPSLEEGRDAALRTTEQQIKAARTRVDGSVMSSGPSKISSMRRTFASFSATGASGKIPRIAPVPQWTEQDVQAALRLVNEGWEDQARRLEQFLDRNWRLAQGMPLDEIHQQGLDGSEEQRPGTAGSLSKILEKIASDRTPTVEKQFQLGESEIPRLSNGTGPYGESLDSPTFDMGEEFDMEKHAFLGETIFSFNGKAPGEPLSPRLDQGSGLMVKRMNDVSLLKQDTQDSISTRKRESVGFHSEDTPGV